MKIERINDTSIRCTLSSFDLGVRNLSLGELSYGSPKAKSLFSEMMQKASNEVGFDAEGSPLMIEAIPLSNESVVLVITKVEDPEEIDTRFAKFSPQPDSDMPDVFRDDYESVLEGAAQPAFINTANEKSGQTGKKTTIRIFNFKTLDQVTEAAAAVKDNELGANTLYKDPQEKTYYLVMDGSNLDVTQFSSTCNILADFGKRIHETYSSASFYEEHFEVIVKDHALQSLSQVG